MLYQLSYFRDCDAKVVSFFSCTSVVDYKGGAAFGPLARLPHTAGVLTDLDPAATARALASLEAEVRRRERLLAEAGAKDVRAVSPAQAPPRLVVAVDEFATLATQHPDVLDCLVRVAAQGRSLGIHLVLATQRPAGAVSPAIRANTSFHCRRSYFSPAEKFNSYVCILPELTL